MAGRSPPASPTTRAAAKLTLTAVCPGPTHRGAPRPQCWPPAVAAVLTVQCAHYLFQAEAEIDDGKVTEEPAKTADPGASLGAMVKCEGGKPGARRLTGESDAAPRARVIWLPSVHNAPCCVVSAPANDNRLPAQARGAEPRRGVLGVGARCSC